MSKSIKDFLEKMIEIQNNLLDFIENEDNFNNLQQFLNEQKIQDNKDDITLILHLITKIANNYHHLPLFFDKIDRILGFFQHEIQKYFSNSEIFNIFKSNKRILLFLIESNILILDKYIVNRILTNKYFKNDYQHYFFPEIRPFIKEKWFPNYGVGEDDELPENFYENRKKGENNSYICNLIQNDSVEEFIIYVNKNNIFLESSIKSSIYETNSFLIQKKEPTLIEYAAFYGSIQIFQYLNLSNAELTPMLWLYAIHGKNGEIIHLLEENKVEPDDKTFQECFTEAVKCHHNDIAQYIKDNLVQSNERNVFNPLPDYFGYYNFTFIDANQINGSTFNYLCRYDYDILVEVLIRNGNIDVNSKKILKSFCFL